MSRRARRQSGFTLLETLVAMTLLALLAGALMPVFQQGLAVLERGDRRTQAVMLAQALLEEHAVRREEEGAASAQSGAEGEFQWQVERVPWDAAVDGGPPIDEQRRQHELVQVRARVQFGDGAEVALSTLVLEALR